MNTSLEHLPEPRQLWISAVARTIHENFDGVEMVILYGSYARGDHVEDPIGNNVDDPWGPMPYFSDLDICVLTRGPKAARRIERSPELTQRLTRPDDKMRPQLIVHTINFFNRKLEFGEFFFVDILREGVMLYDSGNYTLSYPRKLTEAERLQKMREDYECWGEKGFEFLEGVGFYESRDKLTNAAFLLHQAAENLMAAGCLLVSGYRPHTHDLQKLKHQCTLYDPGFASLLRTDTPEEERLSELLQSCYLDTRYKKNFIVDPADLAAMKQRVLILREKIESLRP